MNPAPRPNYLIGPSGWSYPDWAGVVYPRNASRKFDQLSFLAKYFSAIELNVSFYRTVTARMSASWVRRVDSNPRFRFTAKLHQKFTHERSAYSRDAVDEFLTGLKPLAEAARLGCLLMQFPWSFRRDATSIDWLRRLADDFRDHPLVAELRHDSWCVPETQAELREWGVGYCNIDQPRLPHCPGPSAIATSDIGYVRFHGRRADTWFARNIPSFERYNYLYTSVELEEWEPRIKRLGSDCQETYVFTNNHHRGQAPANALQLHAMLYETKIEVPSPLLDHYPELSEIHQPAANSVPETLF